MRGQWPAMTLRTHLMAAAAWLMFCGTVSHAAPLAITPFNAINQSPLVQIFGLPSTGSAAVLGKGRGEFLVSQDIANSMSVDSNSREMIFLDGEGYRTLLSVRHGIGNRCEIGLELPFVGYGGGVFDSFIEGWHQTFGLPNGDRSSYPRNRLLFRYDRDGSRRLLVDNSGFGLGDIRLTGALQLFREETLRPRALALRSSLKIPTGDSGQLRGSGSTDFALWLSASDDYGVALGHVSLFGSAGGMVMSKGDVLPDQQRVVAGFGSLGIGWAPADWIALILQFSGNTPLYQGSTLTELSGASLQLHSGGTLRLAETTFLDIAVSEDIAVNTAPDVALHLAIRHQF